MTGRAKTTWSKFIGWIDRDIPWLRPQQLFAIAPLCVTLFIAPGSPAMFAALGFYFAVTVICIWRLGVFARKRQRIDGLIWKNMFRRFREGRWLPVIRRRG
jgi:hypothetical protein